MGETSKIINMLKREIKARGLTYKDLADRLKISEASVKRLFAEETFSLDRFAKACEAIGTTMTEMIKEADSRSSKDLPHLTLEQEEMLALDASLYEVFHRLLRGDSQDEIRARLNIDAAQMTRLLVSLDKIGCIELRPGNLVKLKTPRLIRWDSRGPLMKAYGTRVMDKYFRGRMDGDLAYSRFLTAPLSDQVAAIFAQKIRALADEIEEMWEWDLKTRPNQGSAQHGILLSCRPWTW